MTREITVVSGKGGTGKSSVTAAFARLAATSARAAMICDLDVDAADLHLLLAPEVLATAPFSGGRVATLDSANCAACGVCEMRCRYGAVREDDDGFAIDAVSCEGCGVCAHFCPSGAIRMMPRVSGRWFRSRTASGPMFHAELYPGEENSGKLVSLLREEARGASAAEGRELILADGPPGVGCPVISAITGSDMVVIVTEPTASGVHDLARIADLCGGLKVPAVVLVNKAGLDASMRLRVQEVCDARRLPVIGEIPFSTAVVAGLVRRVTLDRIAADGVAEAVTKAWHAVLFHLAHRLPAAEPKELQA